MSVANEFSRLVGSCIDFLEGSERAAARPWATALHSARALGADDLSEAASRVLALGAQSPSIEEIEFSTTSECDEFRQLCDHMMAISRVVVGAPAAVSKET
jgi:hypothetical protein